jgi:hypothetical protein
LSDLPKLSPQEIIEELRWAAHNTFVDIFPHADSEEDTLEGEAASMIETMLKAFHRIVAGDGDPVKIAKAFTDPIRQLFRLPEAPSGDGPAEHESKMIEEAKIAPQTPKTARA